MKYQPDISGCYQPSPDMSISGDISGHIRLICPGAAPGLPGEGISLIRGLITPGVARQITGPPPHSNALTQRDALNRFAQAVNVRCPPLHAPLRRPCPRPPSREVRHSHPLACAQQAPRGSSDGLSAPRALMTSTNGNQTTSSGAGHERRRASHHLVRALRPAHGKRAVPVTRVVLCTCSAIRSCA